VTICHRTHSKKHRWVKIRVDRHAVKAHLRHGDFVVDASHPCPPTSGTGEPKHDRGHHGKHHGHGHHGKGGLGAACSKGHGKGKGKSGAHGSGAHASGHGNSGHGHGNSGHGHGK